MLHKLKTWTDLFQAIVEVRKRFEIRKDDRGFKQGDELDLYEYDPEKGKPIEAKGFTGRRVKCLVLSVWRGLPGLPEDRCIMDIVVIDEHKHMEVKKK